MNVNCQCDHCGGVLEFEADLFERRPAGEQTALGKILGQSIDCPACGKSTVLYLPSITVAPARRRSRRIWAVLIVLLCLGFGLLAFQQIESVLRDVGLFAGGVLTIIVGAVLAVFAVVLTLMWILFPIVVYLQLKKIVLSLQSIDRKTRVNAAAGSTEPSTALS